MRSRAASRWIFLKTASTLAILLFEYYALLLFGLGSAVVFAEHLYTAGELLRLDQLHPDPEEIALTPKQLGLFGAED